MLGSTPITAVLGSGVDNTNHESVRSYIRAACDAGLSLLLITPGTKVPFDGRTARKRTADDKAAQAAAKEAGHRDWKRVKSPSGLALATTDKTVLTKKGGYLDRYIEAFGTDCAVNLAVEVGGSRLVIVDCDTTEQRRAFLADATGDADSDVPPTVLTPGSVDHETGDMAHYDGGHFWFTVPEGVEMPTSTGSMTVGSGAAAYSVLWHRRYALIPPSTRPEGRYEMLGRDYPVPGWLQQAIDTHAEAKRSRIDGARVERDESIAGEIDEWAETVSWADILEPLGWTPTVRPDTCGCDVWTAPGLHNSPKSATAHDAGCSLGRYTETNAPLHIWTDNPGEPFEDYVGQSGTKTLSKLQAVAWAGFDGDVGKAMDSMGLAPAPTTIERETGVNTAAIVHDEVDTAGLTDELEVPEPDSQDTGSEVNDASALPGDEELSSGEQDQAQREYEAEHGTPFDDEAEVEADILDTGLNGLPVIAPFAHWRHMPAPEYVIDGLIEHGGLSCIIGPPGVGKSSVAIDMACCIATGRAWQGRRTLKTRVLYLPGEGLSGAIQRMNAWLHHNEVDEAALTDGLRLGNSIIQLGADTEAWSVLAEYIIRQQIGLIIFDTFARMSLGIEENSATEVGRAIVRFDQVRKLTNAGVLIVHHTAKNNPASARGSSALNGALDSELLVSDGMWDFDDFGAVDDNGQVPSGKKIQLSTTKQKNAEQMEHPMPLLMRSSDAYPAPYITGPNGALDPMLGSVVLARPTEEPVVETAIRVREFVDQFPEQGVTRADIVAGVRPDAYIAQRRDAPKAWKHKVMVAIDRGLAYDLLETASGQRLGARYVPGPATSEAARQQHTRTVITDQGGNAP